MPSACMRHPHRALGERAPNEIANEFAANRKLIGKQTAENSLSGRYRKIGSIKTKQVSYDRLCGIWGRLWGRAASRIAW